MILVMDEQEYEEYFYAIEDTHEDAVELDYLRADEEAMEFYYV